MRIGVVGCGYWGSKQVRAFSSIPTVSQLVAIDERPEVRAAIGDVHPRAILRASLAGAMDEIDAVVVATPAESHFDIAAEAIAAGKHVLVEKPMTTSVDDAVELVRMADQAGVTLASGHTFLYSRPVQKLVELAVGGELGTLHYLDSVRLNLGKYRADVNVFWDLAAHDISIIAALLGTAPTTVSAWGSRNTARYGEDVGTLRMTFDQSQFESTVRVSWLDPVKIRRMTVVGSQQMAVYDDSDNDTPLKIFDRGRRLLGPATSDRIAVTYRYGQMTAPHIDTPEPLVVAATDFVLCCQSGQTPIADGVAGLNVVAVLEASNLSLAEQGAPVAVGLPTLNWTAEQQPA